MKNIFNFFNRKTDYTAKQNDLAEDAISFVVDEHKIYVKDQWFGGSGDGSGSGSEESTVIENPYDDTEIRGLISGVNSRLDNLVLLTQQDVQNTVTSMIADMRSFIDNFGWDAMFNDSGWDTLDLLHINLAIALGNQLCSGTANAIDVHGQDAHRPGRDGQFGSDGPVVGSENAYAVDE